jgi:phosphogluconate dehydratase
MLTGSLGKSVLKISSVDPSRHIITAPAKVFNSEAEVKAAFANDQLNKDVVLVVRMQGPQANGMPELHSLTPLMSILQEKGHRVALVTDGRMSGASGKVPSAIHVCPEAIMGGAIAKVQDGDMITLDAVAGKLHVDADLDARILPAMSNRPQVNTFGQPLFAGLRGNAAPAEQGGGVNPLIGS